MSPAYRKGASLARQLRRLERRGIIGGAVNPYTLATPRRDWQAGFAAAYYGEGVAA
jgi:hypothetical protein